MSVLNILGWVMLTPIALGLLYLIFQNVIEEEGWLMTLASTVFIILVGVFMFTALSLVTL